MARRLIETRRSGRVSSPSHIDTVGTGAGTIYLKLRQAGVVANHKRVDRLYADARLQVADCCTMTIARRERTGDQPR
jgi:hypothetical protein